MKILVHMLPEMGHLNPTYPLSRLLAGRGHEVIYTALPDMRAAIESRGFQCVCLHADIAPRGTLPAIEQCLVGEERERAWGRIRDRVHAAYMCGERIERLLRQVDPDLVLADVVALSPLQFAVHALGIPCLQVSTSLSQRHGAQPPLICALDVDTPELLLEAARWECSCVRSFDAVPHTGIMASFIDAYCTRYAYPPGQVSFDTAFWPALTRYPEAVLCEAAFDVAALSSAVLHLPTSVDIEREERVDAELEAFVSGARLLVYASLGSLPGRYPHGARFFRAFIEAMREAPHWNAVLAVGSYADHEFAAAVPRNVLVVRSAPQIRMLRSAAVFVTHAGLGSVREAIELEVPMIAVPQLHDQPGNAARIVHHEIGVSIPPEAVTAPAIRAAVNEILEHREIYRRRIHDLAEACRAERLAERTVAVVESAAGKVRAPRRPPQADDARRAPSQRGWMLVGGVAGLLSLRCLPRTDTGRDAELGEHGFAAAVDLIDALAIAGGTLLARVELNGSTRPDGEYLLGTSLRCLWFLQAEELLFEFAQWCAEQAMAVAAHAEPLAAAAFADLLDERRRLRVGGASFGEQLALAQRVFESASQLWHEGFAAASLAADLTATEAAHGAHWLAAHALARAAAGTQAGAAAGMQAYCREFRAVRHRFGRELDRRVARQAALAGIEWDAA